MAFPFKRVRRGLINQSSEGLDCVLTWALCGPSDVVMDELKTCCHINMSAGGDGWEPRIWQGGQQPQSTAQRPKGEHEMPISYDNPDAHAFWHRMHLAMLTGLPVAFKDAIPLLFLSCFSLSSSPLSLHVVLSTCHPLDLFVFIQIYFCPSLFFYTSPRFTFSRDVLVPRPSFYHLSLFALFLLCILSSFSVRHKNNRLFLTIVSFQTS